MFLCPVGQAMAESVYVSDMVRVNVRSEPNLNSTVVGVVTTDMVLEKLEQRSGFHKVRLPEGAVGWVKDEFLTAEKTARVRLKEQEAQGDGLGEELLKAHLAKAQEENERLKRQAATLEERLSAMERQVAAEQETTEPVRASDHLLYWIGGTLLVVLLGIGFGFSSGVGWHKKQVSRRLGGLRI